jgi:TetR/AcrR family transcriptional regulator, transcriptional repressor for nem operon
MKKTAAQSKQATHDRIVDAAACAIRRAGYDGAGVADVMKAAGLTHGGFYAHFASREAMLAEAADRAGSEVVQSMESIAATVPSEQTFHAMVRAYLSEEHVKSIETGCAMAALGSELPRQAPEVRRAATRRIKEMLGLIARQFPGWGEPGVHERAMVTASTMIGALILARAVDDPRFSEALRVAAVQHLISSN